METLFCGKWGIRNVNDGSSGTGAQTGTLTVKRGLAQMLKGGVIMDVVTPEQATIAQEAGAVAVMALERIPADIRSAGGVARMSDLSLVQRIMDAVTIPVMAKARIGHFAEAQCLEALGVDYVDESEVLTPADEKYHIAKHAFRVPFVCGARDLGEALRRIAEGAAMIRSKGEAGSGNIVEAVRHMRAIRDAIAELTVVPPEELVARARDLGAPLELVREVAQKQRLPVVLFCAGGVATPADAALMMQLGAEGIFVGSGIFKAAAVVKDGVPEYDEHGFPKIDPEIALRYALAIVQATTHYADPQAVVAASKSLGGARPMSGLDLRGLDERQLLAPRGN
jgi:pyridoxal 5'-phosphate synthase pdxS subunit